MRCKNIDQDRDQLVEFLPRKNELSRQTETLTKSVAANVNIIVVVCATEPIPSLELIDHYIVAAESLPASTAIVVNKIDLSESKKIVESIKNKYHNLQYPIIETSIEIQTTIENLAQQLKNYTCVFVGQSGVGKSTLINSLIPSIDLNTQAISNNIQQGKHTTSVTTLYDLPQGGELIDSPGVRDFSLPQLSQEKIIAGFCEISELGNQCKYHNCIHVNEPQCNVKHALQNGELNAERYASYKKMIERYT